LTCFT